MISGIFRKYLVCVLLAVSATLLVAAHMAGDSSLLAEIGPKASGFLFIVALTLVLLPATVRPSGAAEPVRPVPRTLPRDMLNDPALKLTLPERIESAIEASKIESRSLGVLSLQVAEFDALSRRLGAEPMERIVAKSTEALKRQLRATDRASGSGRDEILVCLPLMADRRDLESVAARLARTVQSCLAAETGEAEPAGLDCGVAMYPIDGYSGEDLIASARMHALKARAARLGRPGLVRRAVDGPAPVMPPRKAARSRRARGASAA